MTGSVSARRHPFTALVMVALSVSVRAWATTEAVAELRKGLDLLSGVPDDAARQVHELDLQVTLGNALIATAGWSAPEPGEAFARARELCEQLNQPTQLAAVLRGQWSFHLIRAELDQAQHHVEEMRRLGKARNDVMWECFSSYTGGDTCCFLGKFMEARKGVRDDRDRLQTMGGGYAWQGRDVNPG